MARDILFFTKVTNFRQIWSHWLVLSRSKNLCLSHVYRQEGRYQTHNLKHIIMLSLSLVSLYESAAD